MKNAWLINKDYDSGESKEGAPVEIIGPFGVTATAEEIKEKGTHFKLFDDDGLLYYSGYCLNNSSFAPLDNYGTPNAGCTEIKYRNTNGEYETL